MDVRLPLWSAYALLESPSDVFALHCDYVSAGCDVITAATFRTSRYSLSKVNKDNFSSRLTQLAIDLAKKACSKTSKTVLVAATIGPLEDCNRPDLTPSDSMLIREHSHHIDEVVQSGCDIVFIETMPSVREALIAAGIALRYSKTVWVSLQSNEDGTAFYDGSPPDSFLSLCNFPILPELIAINCSSLSSQFQLLSNLSKLHLPMYLGCYPNVGIFSKEQQWLFNENFTNQQLVDYFQKITHTLPKIHLLGGCCGTTPEHIASLREAIDKGFLTFEV